MTVPSRKNQPRSLSDIFNQFAKDATRLFPATKGRLLIYDANEKATYARESLDLKKAGYSDTQVDRFLKKELSSKVLETYASVDNKLDLHFILYSEPVAPADRAQVPLELEKDILFTLDHELGHIVIKDPVMTGENEQYMVSVGESIADAFAVIRHYQRYGLDSDSKASITDPWARVAALGLHGDNEHFTTTMLEEIIRQKNTIDYTRLTPQQTIEVARRFATEYTPASSVVNRLYRKLKPVRDAFDRNEKSDAWLKSLARITLDPHTDSYTFRMCSKMLEGYMAGRTDAYGVSIHVSGPYWDDVRVKLKESEMKHAQEGMLFNIDAIEEGKRPPRPAANQNKPKL